MKKIFLIIIILVISLRGLTQGNPFPINATNGSAGTGVMTKGRLSVDSLLQINTTCFSDTAQANRGNIDRIAGAMIRLCDNSLMLRSNDATKWIGLGGAGTISTINFYSDSSLIICYGNGVCDTISFNNTINNSITNIYNNSITNIFLINGDSCAVIQTGGGINLDTFCVNFQICSSELINDSTIRLCSCPDSLTLDTTCVTFTFPPHSLYFNRNWTYQPIIGVTEAGTNPLVHNTDFNTATFQANFTGYPYGRSPFLFSQQQNYLGSPSIASFRNTGTTPNLSINFSDSLNTCCGVDPDTPFYGWMGANRRGYFISTNLTGYGNLAQTGGVGSQSLNGNTAKWSGIWFHDLDLGNDDAVTIFGAPPSSTLASFYPYRIAVFQKTGRVQLPQYVNIADAATDSAFYKGANGQINYGKVNTTSVNIYNSDGTLDGDRLLSGNNKSLTFDSLKSYFLTTKADAGNYVNNFYLNGILEFYRQKSGTSVFNDISIGDTAVALTAQNSAGNLETFAVNPTFTQLSTETSNKAGKFIIKNVISDLTTSSYTNLAVWDNDTLKSATSLAGTGSRTVIADANGVLSAPVNIQSKGLYISFPTATDTVGMWQTQFAITVTSLKTVLWGDSPSVTYQVYHGTNVTSGTALFTTTKTCTSTTTGCSDTSTFNDNTIAAGEFIWIVNSAQSGTARGINFTINYTQD